MHVAWKPYALSGLQDVDHLVWASASRATLPLHSMQLVDERKAYDKMSQHAKWLPTVWHLRCLPQCTYMSNQRESNQSVQSRPSSHRPLQTVLVSKWV